MSHRSNAHFLPLSEVINMDCPVDKGLVKVFHSGASGSSWEVPSYVGAKVRDSSISPLAVPARGAALAGPPPWLIASRGGCVASWFCFRLATVSSRYNRYLVSGQSAVLSFEKCMVDKLSVYQHTLCPLIGFAWELAPGAGGARTALGAFYFLSSTAHATGA